MERRSPDRRDEAAGSEINQSEGRRAETSRLAIISSPLSEARTGEIRQLLTNGGTALLVMNDPQTAKTLAQLTGAPEAGVTEATVANYAMLGQMDFTHPLFAPFADP